jgi:hypothetical protein
MLSIKELKEIKEELENSQNHLFFKVDVQETTGLKEPFQTAPTINLVFFLEENK